MKTSGHLDWLAVTYSADHTPNDTLPRTLCQSPWTLAGHGSNGYRKRYTNQLGASLMTDGEVRQGIHLVLSGHALEQIRFTDVTEQQLLTHVLDGQGRLSRLDVAINVFEATETPENIARAYDTGKIKTPARSGLLRTGVKCPDQNFTLGSRQSDRYLRVYDKAAEQGIPDMSWLRIELELKKRRANTLAHVLASAPNTRPVINRAISDYFTYSTSDLWSSVFLDQTGVLPMEVRKVTSFDTWLYEQVAPAIARHELMNPDIDYLAALTAAVQAARSRLTTAKAA